jgi:hypothetical protein
MSFVEELHQKHKERVARIASRAFVPPPPPRSLPPAPEPKEELPQVFLEWATHERAWEIELLQCGDYERPTRTPTIREVQDVVCKHYGVSRADMLSARRTQDMVFPRHVAIYLCRTLTPHALPKIGRQFGGRDHTTILHAFRRVGDIIAKDNKLREVVETLAYRLGGDCNG